MLTRKGQSTLEYALIIAVVVAGLLLMQHYVKRGFAGRLRTASDDMGEQYDPTGHTGSLTFTQHSLVTQAVKDRVSTSTHVDNQTSTKAGTETVAAYDSADNLYLK